jgi:hypothetical protein
MVLCYTISWNGNAGTRFEYVCMQEREEERERGEIECESDEDDDAVRVVIT